VGSQDPLPNPPHKGEGGARLAPQNGDGEVRLGKPCPFCKASDVEVISLFGSQVMTMQCRCLKCGNYFEASKY